MNNTRHNLERVSDVIAEIEKTLASLKRQAAKAERYKKYTRDIRDLELWVASHRYLELTNAHRVLMDELQRMTAEAEGARVALRVREAEMETGRLLLKQIENRLEKAQTRAFELDNSVKLLESQIAHHQEQLPGLRDQEKNALQEMEDLKRKREALSVEAGDVAARLEGLEEVEQAEGEVLRRESDELERRRVASEEAERALDGSRARIGEAQTRIARAEAVLASFDKRRGDGQGRLDRFVAERKSMEERAADLHRKAEELRARLQGLRGGKDEILSRRDQIEAEFAELREEIRKSDVRVEEAQALLAAKRSRLQSLEEIQQRFEGVGAGVRAVMTRFAASGDAEKDEGVLGLLADRFECPRELTHALAAVLGERLQYVVVDGIDSGVKAIRFLGEEKRGRATMIPRVPLGAKETRGERAAVEGTSGYLIDSVKVDPADRALAEHVLGDVLVVADLDTARRIREHGDTRHLLVTPRGEVLSPDGSLSGGDGEDGGADLLEVQRVVRELHEEVARLEATAREAVERHGELRNGIAQRQAAIETTRTDAHQKELALVETDRDLKRMEEAEREANERIETLQQDAAEQARLLEETHEEQREATLEREAAERAESDAREAVVAAEEVYRLRRKAVEEQNGVVTEVRVRAVQARQQAEADRDVLGRLERSLSEFDERITRLGEEATRTARLQGELAGNAARDRETLAATVEEAVRANDATTALRAEYDREEEALSRHEGALRELRNAIDEQNGKSNELAIKEREASMELGHLTADIREKHDVEVAKVLTDYHARELPDDTVTSRIDDLHRLIRRMGEINTSAIRDFEERSERYQHLTTQRSDLEAALVQLEKAIRKMNRESRRLFRETFEGVNLRFQKVFPRLFGGGKAELRLTDPDDLLESGIDIVAMPPGKKLGLIELMSGGEKALTALSLIIALFQFKPSPFCLLDEVDAPLDEVNITRFCKMVQEMTTQSQFIIITHSRPTIMIADVLYGITMETPGISKLVSVEVKEEAVKQVSPTAGESVAVA
jgi:chromosome segregation protein